MGEDAPPWARCSDWRFISWRSTFLRRYTWYKNLTSCTSKWSLWMFSEGALWLLFVLTGPVADTDCGPSCMWGERGRKGRGEERKGDCEKKSSTAH